MGNGITNNIIDQVKRKLSENGTASTQPKSNSTEPSIQDMITKTVMESFSSGGDKKSTGSFNPQNLIDMATQLTLIRSLPKLLEGALGDSSDKQVSSPMLEQIMKRIDKMDERISQEAERQKQKELIESAIKPYKDQIDALMALSRKDENSPKKNEEIVQVQTALAGLEKNINDTLLNVKKNEEAKQADALRTDIENIERAMESQYNNLFALVNSDRNRERSPANPMAGMREALKYLQEEKDLMKQLGMIKENIDDGSDLKSTLDNLKDVTSRVPELGWLYPLPHSSTHIIFLLSTGSGISSPLIRYIFRSDGTSTVFLSRIGAVFISLFSYGGISSSSSSFDLVPLNIS